MLPETASLLTFIVASLALLVVPGPAVLYVVTRSIDQGALAGIVSVLGIGVGSIVHVIAAVLGLSALLASSALVFMFVKYLGAIYLVYLGIRKLLEKNHVTVERDVRDDRTLWKAFYQGAIVNILNPKTALFFLAFLPQFIDPARGSVSAQILLLGLIFISMAIVSDGIYALLAGTARRVLKHNVTFWKRQRYFAGSIYILLGLTTAFSGLDNRA
ncbi:MAG: LysE family translocator [Chloroflexi bacterium]|nr:MAG: LysE family translocator [Chloroflexota bacterium]